MKIDFEKKSFDWVLLILILLLLGIGLAMCSSASFVRSSYQKSAEALMKKQVIAAAVGSLFMIILSAIDYKFWKRFAGIALYGATALNLYTAFFGKAENGARRWLSIAGHNLLQPSELMKIAVVLYLAAVFSDEEYSKKTKTFGGFLIAMIPLGIGVLSVLAQKHTSATIIIVLLIVAIFAFASLPKLFWLLGVGVGAAGVGALVLIKPDIFDHIEKRITIYKHTHFGIINPEGVEEAYLDQIQNSIWAIGSGGLFGKGFGNSIQKYSYLPESYNDFIFAIVAEELGYVGVVIIIILFVALILRGFKVAKLADDSFGMYMAVGFTTMVAVQMVLNMSVVSALIPVTGISLPFFSYGGTAMVIILCMMGILLNIAKQANYSKIGG